ncbi:MAG: TetR family transcriptional regulator [Chloroflexi bacterium]|nr:TetR family transcriptional regulator [Chloroflexota bacterium]
MARQREFDKEAVLEQAMLLFWEKGYEATSIRDLIKSMNISSSSMYEVFGDKRSIFLAALARFCLIEQANIAQLAENAATPQRFVEQLFASLDELTISGTSQHGSLAFNAMIEFGTQDADVTQLLLSHYFAIAKVISETLQRGQAAGIVNNRLPAPDLAHTILTALNGASTVKGVRPDFTYIPAITQVLLSLLNP